ncbi:MULTISPECIES: GNAT family N-acetyltransferase [Kitasatospora]|uniref:Putative acetyltransferase n=1 Tax=Kitasatospora setae (strain ATCC 33774 / DSM 43861 / JCM 3304 / KCC A-0304 / NBRC 14216 / KM-6054) TaxID=452652 RepID=E4N936_KITSK|nr:MULTISPECIES: GNAT family N-acetyltransferase [Kitasatospora]BAJ27717.1 putative acetyltransferase [Kitasatospora setae KM-6054]
MRDLDLDTDSNSPGGLDTAVLDDPVGASLAGAHAHLARRRGRAVRYDPEVAGFSSVGVRPGAGAWDDLAGLLGAGEFADLFSCPALPPADWGPEFVLAGHQLVRVREVRPALPAGLRVVELGAADVPEMLALVERTRPGPFRPRTRELGTYLGVRDGDGDGDDGDGGGALLAMAGERLRPPGFTEVSAVCTAPEARGRGLAAHLVGELAARIGARGERPFLHVAAANTGALALYERLGFVRRADVVFRGFRVP